MKRSFFVLLVLLPASICPADTLLLELFHIGKQSDVGARRTAYATFGTSEASISGSFTSEQTGTVIATATPAQLAKWRSPFSGLQGEQRWEFYILDDLMAGYPNDLWTADSIGGVFGSTAFVPQLGFGLDGYNLTRAEIEAGRVSTLIVESPHHSPYVTLEATAKLKVYGDIAPAEVPEPATALLLLCGTMCAALLHRVRYNRAVAIANM